MRCVPLLIMIRNVALAMVTEVFTPVEVERNARLENRLETKGDGRSGALVKLTASPQRGQSVITKRLLRPPYRA